ncbi:type II toxin-antitoxin system HicA family toxin [Propionivibrio limicola]|uniref:type II toxin-antitoxin system HicA family toxin n=1 Tax=Propionivibrio limicola TaxID=167645 RepID=UPI001292A45A|nr:type II toxin-antitoxin system HicA family toxin [Propionivibrio limicola]
MSHKHLHLLEAIYRDPPSANIHWREVESLLSHLGATVEPAHGARFRVVLNRIEFYLHQPHNNATCQRQEIKQLREALARAGVTLSAYEASQKAD